MVVVLVMPPYFAEIVTAVDRDTLSAVIGNVAELAPAGIVTLAGTTAADVRELVSVIT